MARRRGTNTCKKTASFLALLPSTLFFFVACCRDLAVRGHGCITLKSCRFFFPSAEVEGVRIAFQRIIVITDKCNTHTLVFIKEDVLVLRFFFFFLSTRTKTSRAFAFPCQQESRSFSFFRFLFASLKSQTGKP